MRRHGRDIRDDVVALEDDLHLVVGVRVDERRAGPEAEEAGRNYRASVSLSLAIICSGLAARHSPSAPRHHALLASPVTRDSHGNAAVRRARGGEKPGDGAGRNRTRAERTRLLLIGALAGRHVAEKGILVRDEGRLERLLHLREVRHVRLVGGDGRGVVRGMGRESGGREGGGHCDDAGLSWVVQMRCLRNRGAMFEECWQKTAVVGIW